MGVPGWLLNATIGFLEERTIIVTYKGENSNQKDMPGGGPQGTILGLFLFLIQINDAGFPQEVKELGKIITQNTNKRKEIPTSHWKYVDDLTLAEALDLKKCLVSYSEKSFVKPLNYHNRTEHKLPPQQSQVQNQHNKLQEYAKVNEMKINIKKTKSMLFNTARARDFTPELTIGGEQVELVEEMKLLGVIISSDLKWNLNTQYITKRGYSKLWMLRRLKSHGVNQNELVDIYI